MATSRHAAVPSPMKAVRIAHYGSPEQLKYDEAPLPEFGPGHVLAKVRYAGVNPVDWKIREGHMKQLRPASFPPTLGQDFAGEIVTVGGDSDGFRTGEPHSCYAILCRDGNSQAGGNHQGHGPN